jgi:DNA modification methylase
MVTDPPYGVEYDPSWRAEAGVNRNRQKMGEVTNDDRSDWGDAWALSPATVAYVWHGGLHAGTVQESLERVGLEVRSQIVWVKDRFALGRGSYHWRHEPCWFAVRAGSTASWCGDRKQQTVWEAGSLPPYEYLLELFEAMRDASSIWEIPARDDAGHGHGTQKPVECMERPLRNHTGDVYEPFAGSGTTIIAAERQSRVCYAMELEPKYVQVCIDRWEAYTGATALKLS